ncbi:MAG: hypothetical protein HBSAPP03_20630 [Phycisphaerae bacterium]|nr:MAG: hypothetical protein HBSAPP03_20630 [Phycisphaerae bacterium]
MIPPATAPGAASAPPSESPLRSRAAWTVLLIASVLGLVADLVTKWAAFRFLDDAPVVVSREAVLAAHSPMDTLPAPIPRVEVIRGVLDLTLVLNPGAVFGIGAGKRVVFMIFTVLALGFAFALFARWTHRRDHLSHAALGLLISGGLGNLYDRMMFACVRDFLHPLPGMVLPFGWSWPWGGREVWPYVSNVADLALIIAIAILIWRTLRPFKVVEGTKP